MGLANSIRDRRHAGDFRRGDAAPAARDRGVRSGKENRAAERLDPTRMLPAIGQGALGIECRLADPVITETIAFFNHPATSYAVRAERALLKRCEGGCQVPIAAHGTVHGTVLRLVGFIAAVDGSRSVKGEISGTVEQCEQLGIQLADRLLTEGGKAILEEVYQREFSSPAHP